MRHLEVKERKGCTAEWNKRDAGVKETCRRINWVSYFGTESGLKRKPCRPIRPGRRTDEASVPTRAEEAQT